MKYGKTIALLVGSFALYYYGFIHFGTIKTSLDSITHYGLLSYILTYFIIGIPIFIGTWLISGYRNVLAELGLAGSFPKGIGLAFLFALPMFLGGFLFFEWKRELEVENMIAATLCAGFFEELYFRGFLFGQLFRHTRLGFLPAVLLGAVIFALGHLHQSPHVNELVGIFAITFMGAFFFAWLYVEWNYNLWVPIWLHTFMNLAWYIFDMDQTALGNTYANVFRALTIALAIIFTIRYKRKNGQPMTITRKTLLRQP